MGCGASVRGENKYYDGKAEVCKNADEKIFSCLNFWLLFHINQHPTQINEDVFTTSCC